MLWHCRYWLARDGGGIGAGNLEEEGKATNDVAPINPDAKSLSAGTMTAILRAVSLVWAGSNETLFRGVAPKQ